MTYICGLCKKSCKQIRVDILIPKEERVWQCEKCYFKLIKVKKNGKR